MIGKPTYPLTHIDLFSGYGGFSLALKQAGVEVGKHYYSEIDKYAIANYRYNFPAAECLGSVTDISGNYGADLITFGWPCQDNSLAGKRKGHGEGTRSGLLSQAVRIVAENRPRNFIAENVPGLLSVSKGVDIIEAIKLLSFLSESMPQYDVEMQLLNTCWFGLPQNRERLFFVGYIRSGGPRKILPFGESYSGVTQGSTEAAIVRTITAGGNSGGHHSGMTIIKQIPETKGNSQGDRIYDINGVSVSITSQGGGLGAKTGLYQINDRVRRLTPLECERLQGLPDNWTKYGILKGKITELSDTQRYKLTGNGVSIPPVQWIMEQLYAA